MAVVDVLLPGYVFGADSGSVAFCSIVLVEAGDRRILVDTGHVGRRRAIFEALAQRGLTVADIDAVLLTHTHWDHVQNFDAFPNATLLLHPDERRYAQRPHPNDWATPPWTGLAIETARIEEVGEGQVIAEGVRVIELPGHSPGTIGLLAETEAGLAGITGDAVHSGPVALSGRTPIVFWNEAQANASVQRAVEVADIIYPGHDGPFRVRDGQVQYERPFELTLQGLQPNQPGLRFAPRDWSVFVMPGIEEQRLPELEPR